MDEYLSSILTRNTYEIGENLQLAGVISYLQSRGILRDVLIDEIRAETTEHEKRVKLLRILKQCSNQAFVEFLRALVVTGQHGLLTRMFPRYDQCKDGQSILNGMVNVMGQGSAPSIMFGPLTGAGDTPLGHMDNGLPPPTSATNDVYSDSEFEDDDPQALPMPSPLSIEEKRIRDQYQHAEVVLYEGIQETSGILTELEVETTDANHVTRYNSDPNIYPCNPDGKKGLVLVINNAKFQRDSGLGPRDGSNVDCKNVSILFTQLGYTLKTKTDCTAERILRTMDKFRQLSGHEGADSSVVVILSHGEQGQIYGVDGRLVDIDTITAYMNSTNCPPLAGKPKLFFFQACRGKAYDFGRQLRAIDSPDGPSLSHLIRDPRQSELLQMLHMLDVNDVQRTEEQIQKLPLEADFLMAYSTTPGYVSWRNSVKGSWFIQAMCVIFARHAWETDLMDLLTMVNRRVAEAFQSSDGAKQVPEPRTRLLKKFYFCPVRASADPAPPL